MSSKAKLNWLKTVIVWSSITHPFEVWKLVQLKLTIAFPSVGSSTSGSALYCRLKTIQNNKIWSFYKLREDYSYPYPI